MSALTSHILDVTAGAPAPDVAVELVDCSTSDARVVGQGRSDADGRIPGLGPTVLEPGRYLLRFDVASYFSATGQPCLFPEVVVTVMVAEPTAHLHVPLLVTPNAYSVYRGS